MILTCAVKSKLFAGVGLLCSAFGVWAQSSTFTYQGQLQSNNVPATGIFDLRFTLHDAATFGNQVGNPLTNSPVNVSNGLFTVELDFGSAVFNGSLRWLEIGVRTNGNTGAFAQLSPRQQITATPYALRAANFSGTLAATNLTGKISDTNLSANVALLTNTAVFTRTVIASNFVGSGLTLTNLSTTNLVGTLPDARLSPNVALVNTANTVFQGSLTATNFHGFGGGLSNVPGRIFNFVPTTVSRTADDNYGYLAQNDSNPVVITLPPTVEFPVGNIIRVSASGAAGWIVAQQPDQSILVGNLLDNVGITWTTNGNPVNWKAIAAAADGRKLVAVASPGYLYTSTNYGANWTQTGTSIGSVNWSSVASSADGTKLVACINGSYIYTSTDSGVNWTPRTTIGSRSWTSVASSLDGTRLVACASGYGVAVSANSGANWTSTLGNVSWSGVASSGDGLQLAAVAQGSYVYTSANGGTTWTNRNTTRSWTCVASSSDGSVLVAGVNSVNNFLYTSTDFGVTWLQDTTAANWSGVACSADGTRMIAVAGGAGVYVSQNSGLNWSLRNNLPTAPTFTGAACSSDGSTMAATAYGHGVFVSSKVSTTIGTVGQLIGSRLSAVELQHLGNGVFMPISFVGTIRVK
jgi:hypothetical protein